MNTKVTNAIEKKEIDKLLLGEFPYDLFISQYSSEVLPTEINEIVFDLYQYNKLDTIISSYFETTLKQFIITSAEKFYIALLYFDVCLYFEDKGIATFNLDRNEIVSLLKEYVVIYERELQSPISFANGNEKLNPWHTVVEFNSYYSFKYNFSFL